MPTGSICSEDPKSWCLFCMGAGCGLVLSCQVLSGAVRCCQVLLGAVRCCQVLLGAVRCCFVFWYFLQWSGVLWTPSESLRIARTCRQAGGTQALLRRYLSSRFGACVIEPCTNKSTLCHMHAKFDAFKVFKRWQDFCNLSFSVPSLHLKSLGTRTTVSC